MLTIGVDPDLHDTAFGLWLDGKPLTARVAHVPRKKAKQQEAVLRMGCAVLREFQSLRHEFEEPVRVAVEAQTLQRTGLRQHKRPQDIVVLGNVAGIILAAAAIAYAETEVLFPTPEEWKGQIPKEVMQARLYDALGWGYDQRSAYSVPLRIESGFRHVLAGQWKHVGDALLLAKWAAERPR